MKLSANERLLNYSADGATVNLYGETAVRRKKKKEKKRFN